jgi:citrate lyase subunit beta/citryl-CoA lyase
MLLRSMLFAPANNPTYIRKALSSEADAVVFDLEDAVPACGKQEARDILAAALPGGAGEALGKAAFIRTNAPDSPDITRDLAVGMHPGIRGFVTPKIASPDDLVFIDRTLGLMEAGHGFEAGRFKLLPMIENTSALMNITGIAHGSPRVIALCFGGYDYSSDLKLISDDRSLFHLLPRAMIAAASRSAGVQPIDTPYFAVKDIDGLRREKEEAVALGFAGSLIITPRHIEAVNECFSPSARAVIGAEGVLAAIADAERRGESYAMYGGLMIDAPIESLSRHIADYARRVAAGEGGEEGGGGTR